MPSPPVHIGALAPRSVEPRIFTSQREGLRRPDLSVGRRHLQITRLWPHLAQNLGLRDAQEIGSIIVDPKDPNRLFVAAVGHPTARTLNAVCLPLLDGGQTFEKVSL